jgi:hypothetical protein
MSTSLNDNIFIGTEDPKIQIIMNQTSYTKEEAIEKMELFNNDHIKVIKEYLGVSDKSQKSKSKSLNQEIYTQIRQKLDTSEYRKTHSIDIDQVINNFRESDEKNKNKSK